MSEAQLWQRSQIFNNNFVFLLTVRSGKDLLLSVVSKFIHTKLYTLYGLKKVLPEGLRFYTEPLASKERVFQGFLVGSIKKTSSNRTPLEEKVLLPIPP